MDMRDILTIVNVSLTLQVFVGLMISADNKVCFLQYGLPPRPTLLVFYTSPFAWFTLQAPLLGLPPSPPKGGLKNL